MICLFCLRVVVLISLVCCAHDTQDVPGDTKKVPPFATSKWCKLSFWTLQKGLCSCKWCIFFVSPCTRCKIGQLNQVHSIYITLTWHTSKFCNTTNVFAPIYVPFFQMYHNIKVQINLLPLFILLGWLRFMVPLSDIHIKIEKCDTVLPNLISLCVVW